MDFESQIQLLSFLYGVFNLMCIIIVSMHQDYNPHLDEISVMVNDVIYVWKYSMSICVVVCLTLFSAPG